MTRHGWILIGTLVLAVLAVSCGLDPDDDPGKKKITPIPGGPKDDPDAVIRAHGNGIKGLNKDLLILFITPDHGPTSGGTDVMIIGFNFMRPDPVTEVLFDADPALSFTVHSNNKIFAVTPPHAEGLVSVTLRNGAGDETVGSNFYEYIPPPTCLALSPVSGPEAGGTVVTITTSNFTDDFTVDVPEVLFGATPAAGVLPVNASTMDAITPAGFGVVDVTVIANNQESCTFPGGFTYDPPAGPCMYVSPDHAAEGDTVRIYAMGSCQWTPNTVVTFGTVPATIIDFSPPVVTVEVPHGPTAGGCVDVTANGADAAGGSCTCVLPDGFCYIPARPSCLTLTPPDGPHTGGTDVTIETSGFSDDFTVNLPDVWFDTALATSVTATDATTLLVVTPPDPQPDPTQGYRTVDVTVIANNQESCTFHSGFTYFYTSGSHCMLVDPAKGPLGGGYEVLITSLGPCQWTPNTTVTFGGAHGIIRQYVNEYEIWVEVPTGRQTGPVDVVATGIDPTSPGGSCTCVLPDGFTYE